MIKQFRGLHLMLVAVLMSPVWGQDPTVTPPVQTLAVGGTVALSIDGPPNAPFAFAIASSTCSIATSVGEFGLAANYIVILDGINVGGPFMSGLTLGASGSVPLSGQIIPGLEGLTAYGQSIVMSPSYMNGFKLSTNGMGGPVAVAHIQGGAGMTTFSGQITYGNPGYVIGVGYPGGASDIMSPVRYADIEAVNSSTMAVLATGSTDAVGQYSLTFPSTSDNVFVRVIASTSNNPKYQLSMRMQVNPSGSPLGTEPIWSRSSANFPGNASNSAANLDIPVNPGTTTNNFASGPFNIMDIMIRVADAVRSATGTLSPLNAYCTPNFGETGAFYGGKDGSNVDYVFISGGGMGTATSTDIDFYDDGVIGHEFGHFVETNFKGSSWGGQHNTGQRTLPGLAWSEGYGTWIGGLGLRSPVYADGEGYGPMGFPGFTSNLESEPSHGATPNTGSGPHGIFDESVVYEILWDLHDGSAGVITDTDNDGISLPLDQIFAVFSQFDVNDYVYMVDMLSRLDSANGGPLPTATLTNLMTSPEVTGFTYPPVGIDLYPAPITVGGSASGMTDATPAGTTGTYPGATNIPAGNWVRVAEASALFEFVATATSHTVTLTHTGPAGGAAPNDVDLAVTTVNSDFAVVFVDGGAGVNVHTVNANGLNVGQTYLIWARGFSPSDPTLLFGSAPFTPSSATTFSVTVN